MHEIAQCFQALSCISARKSKTEQGIPPNPHSTPELPAKMKSILLMTLLFGLQMAESAEGDKPPKSFEGKDHPALRLDAPDLTKSDKSATWRMWYIAKGTRSEGLHGTITEGDKEVYGKALQESRVVDGRKLVWHGAWDERKNLFSKSGWLPEDIKSVYPSWQMKKAEATRK